MVSNGMKCYIAKRGEGHIKYVHFLRYYYLLNGLTTSFPRPKVVRARHLIIGSFRFDYGYGYDYEI